MSRKPAATKPPKSTATISRPKRGSADSPGAIPPASGPLAYIFGVRHLSPAGAWHLKTFIQRIEPTAILIEGPSDANVVPFRDPKTKIESQRSIFDFFMQKGLVPPFALLSFARVDDQVEHVLFPMAAYSPEYVAAVEGVKQGAHVAFIDLPISVYLPIIRKSKETKEQIQKMFPPPAKAGQAPSAATLGYLDDPWDAITKLTEEEDVDTWWERWFEHLTDADAYRNSVFQFGLELRRLEISTRATVLTAHSLLRERYMRRAIRETIAMGHSPDKIIVVCGSFHASALVAEEPAMTDDELAALPRIDLTTTMMPYSYERLSSQYGYGAGNKAPRYFEMIWEGLERGKPEEVGARYLTEVLRMLRASGSMYATANLIEAVRLAEGIAAMHSANAPALRDLQEGAIATIAEGHEEKIAKALVSIGIGSAMGKVPAGVPRTSLQDDFWAHVEGLKLEKYAKEDAAKQPNLVINLMPKEGEEELKILAQQKHVFLSRMSFLDVEWSSKKSQNWQSTTWTFNWSPDVERRLAEASLLGNTVEEATVTKFIEEFDKAKGVGEIMSLAERSRECDITDVVDKVIRRAEELLRTDSDYTSLVNGMISCVNMVINPASLGIPGVKVLPLLNAIYLRTIVVLKNAAKMGPPANDKIVSSMKSENSALNLVTIKQAVDEGKWLAVLDDIAEGASRSYDGLASGAAANLLLDAKYVSPKDRAAGLDHETAFENRMSRWLSPANDPGKVADWLHGLISTNATILLRREYAWRAINDFINALDDETFLRLVVSLRRATSSMDSVQVHEVSALIARIIGIAPAELKPQESLTLSEEMEKIRKELLGKP